MHKTVLLFLLALTFACQSSNTSKKNPPSLPENPLQPTQPVNPLPPKPVEPGIPPLPGTGQIFLGEPNPTANINLPYGLPVVQSGDDSWIISRPQYVLSWNPKTRNPNWVSWLLRIEDFTLTGRQENFYIDPILDPYIREQGMKPVEQTDYSGFFFDRGHMVASSDRHASTEDNVTAFYMTNILPQTAFLNQVIWNKLELSMQDWLKTARYTKLLVMAGPIYGDKVGRIGPNRDIAVPKANFKAVYSWDEFSKDKPYLVKAVIMPNVTSIGTDPMEDPARLEREAREGVNIRGDPSISRELSSYTATIERIEAEAKITFPDKLRVSSQP